MTITIDGSLGTITGLAVGGLPDGVVDTDTLGAAAVTAPKTSGAQTGSAPIYGCRAWCRFNGSTVGTNAPTAGGNVSTVTRNGTGDYTINFTTAMPDANYCVTGTSNIGVYLAIKTGTTPLTTSVTVQIGGASDSTITSVAIFS